MASRALAIAETGIGLVSPSPLVGCVIATDEGRIVGEGSFRYDGVKHAETLALEQAGAQARGATAYVTFEPHAHQGRTPPCTDALIAAGIKRVVAPIEDPNPLVSGKGFAHLRDAGIDVTTGIYREEAERLNEKYLHFVRYRRPYVHLKLACSLDGKIATRSGDSRWITGEEARTRVHELRHEYDAILIGANTAVQDDPILTDRSGRERRRPLLRVVLDSELRLSAELNLVRTAGESPVLVFASDRATDQKLTQLESAGVDVARLGEESELIHVLDELGRRSIQSLLVEGGARVAGALLDAGLVNKASFFIAPIIVGGRDAVSAVGGAGADRIADALQLAGVTMTKRGRDIEITGYINDKDKA